MNPTSKVRRGVVAVGVLVGLGVSSISVVSCSNQDDSSSAEKANVAVGDSDTGAAGAEGGASDSDRAPLNATAAGSQAAADRQVISTGRLTVRVDDVEVAAGDAVAIAESAGGYLARQDADLSGQQRVEVNLRVDAKEFDDAMAQIAKLGAVRSRAVDTEDVTDQVVDLELRLENARTSTERLRALLGEAKDLQHVIALEDRLTQREGDIEAMAGQLEVIGDRVDKATIEVSFVEQEPAAAVSDDLPGPLEALRAGGVAFVNVSLAALAAMAFALPFLPFVALAIWLVRRRRGASTTAPTVETALG